MRVFSVCLNINLLGCFSVTCTDLPERAFSLTQPVYSNQRNPNNGGCRHYPADTYRPLWVLVRHGLPVIRQVRVRENADHK